MLRRLFIWGRAGKLLVAHHRQPRPEPRMNIHKNARLTPQGRLLLVKRITEAGWSVVQAAQAAGVSCGRAIAGSRVIAPRGRRVWVIAARPRTAASTVRLASGWARSSGCGGSG